MLTPRWAPLDPKSQQIRAWNAGTRFRVIPAARRSGKTELAKRFLLVGDPDNDIVGALTYDKPFDDGFFVASAPTHDQARSIFWNDFKSLIHPKFRVSVSETTRTIKLYNGVELRVLGMDKPERVEGRPLDGIIMDEYGNMKKRAWHEHVRPALSTVGRAGWAWLIGVPEGRNHYWELFKYARDSGDRLWSAHHWKSSLILPPEEIAQARREMDPLTFEQEYEGSFINFTGRAYYSFGDHNLSNELLHFPEEELIVCFDFNVNPGVAVICQEQRREWYDMRGITLSADVAEDFTAVIGEVHIPNDSNTIKVCDAIVDRWAERHTGDVTVHGDATGGARGTASVQGSDWDLIDEILEAAFPRRYDRAVPRSNPRERVRVNAMNSRLRSSDNTVRMLIHSRHASRLIDDLEGVRTKEDGSGEIDKKKDPSLTHLSDALGYFITAEHPVGGARMVAEIA